MLNSSSGHAPPKQRLSELAPPSNHVCTLIMEFRHWKTCALTLDHLNNIDSYELIAKHRQKTNFVEWTGLRHSLPFDLRIAYHNPDHTALNPSFKIDCSGLFDVTKKKSKDYYFLFVRKKGLLSK